MSTQRAWYQWVVAAYDRVYRWVHRLDAPEARVGSLLSLEVRRCRRALRLEDGRVLRRGAPVGVIHLDNRRAAALARQGRSSLSAGLEFRREFVASLGALAGLCGDGGRLAAVEAFSAVTLYTHGMRQVGFAPAPGDRLHFPRLAGFWVRALSGWLHADGRGLSRRPARACRVWISREELLARHGSGAEPAA